MIVEEKTIESEILYQGAILNLRKDKVLVKEDRTSYREIIEHSGGVVILAVTAEGRIPMVRQYRKAADRAVLELPAGKLEKGEDPKEAALRELKEETGYRAGCIREVCAFFPTVGYSTEILRVFFAEELSPGDTDFDENESIEIEEYFPEALYELIARGELDDGKSLIALLLYQNEKLRDGAASRTQCKRF